MRHLYETFGILTTLNKAQKQAGTFSGGSASYLILVRRMLFDEYALTL